MLVSVSAALAVVSIFLRIALTATGHGHNPLVWRITFLHLDPIAFGALLACSSRLLAWASRWRWVFILVGLAGLFAPLPAGGEILAGGLMATGLVAMAATRKVTFLNNRVLRSCGKYSYAMYVLHPAWIVAPLAKKHPHSTPLMLGSLILGPIVSYGIAVVSWNVLEKHFLKLKRHFPYRYAPVGDTPENIIIAA
jgi:peptidoglycan/LPS O-acetylase OafA/YrhL